MATFFFFRKTFFRPLIWSIRQVSSNEPIRIVDNVLRIFRKFQLKIVNIISLSLKIYRTITLSETFLFFFLKKILDEIYLIRRSSYTSQSLRVLVFFSYKFEPLQMFSLSTRQNTGNSFRNFEIPPALSLEVNRRT